MSNENFQTDQSKSDPEDQTKFQRQSQVKDDDGQDQGATIEYKGRKLSQAEILKKLEHGDTFIETLKAERAAEREEMEALVASLKEAAGVQDLLKQKQQPASESTDPKDIDPESFINQALERFRTEQQTSAAKKAHEANWATVVEKLNAQYGDQTQATVERVAAENELSLSDAAKLARSNPRVFLALFPKDKPNPASSLRGSRNTQSRTAERPKGTSLFKERTVRGQVDIYKARLQAKLDALNS